MTQDVLSGESGLLDRRNWLKANGFDRDPFDTQSWRGNTDPLLETAFLDFDDVDFEKIKAPLQDGGYVFIFAPAGGGKTSIAKRIKRELGPKVVPEDSQILVVEYPDYIYEEEQRTQNRVLDHAIRLESLIQRELSKHCDARTFQQVGGRNPEEVLQDAVLLCSAYGFDAVCVLIDIDSPMDDGGDGDSAFRRILPLAMATHLFDIDGLIFKFLIPSEYKPKYGSELARGNRYPLYEVEWNERRLRRVLEERLIVCQMQSAKESISDPRIDRTASGVSLLSQLCAPELRGAIEDEVVKFGLEFGCPRAMWQLGYYLVEEHFNLSSIRGRRRRDELIERQALDGAYRRLTRELPSYARAQPRRNWRDACRKAKELIANGTEDDLDRALQILRPYDERFTIPVQARLNRAKRQFRQGLMTREEYDVILNQIINDVVSGIC
jgi:hypothetical protein